MHFWELVYSKNYLNHTKIVVLRQFKMLANWIGMNRGLSLNFLGLRSANHVNIQNMCDEYGEAYFNWKIFTNELNMGLQLWSWVEKTVHGVKTHWLSNKEKVPGRVISKEGHANSLLGHEITHQFWFCWKRCNCKLCFLLSTS